MGSRRLGSGTAAARRAFIATALGIGVAAGGQDFSAYRRSEQNRQRVEATTKADLERIQAWVSETDDEVAGTADLACNDDAIFAVGNAAISAFSYDGRVLWRYNGKGGILVPGTHRGILRAGSLPIEHQITAGRQVVVAAPYLYVTSRSERNWKGKLDVITVFDAKSGALVEQIDTATMIVDMAVFGPDLALTTTEGLNFTALKK